MKNEKPLNDYDINQENVVMLELENLQSNGSMSDTFINDSNSCKEKGSSSINESKYYVVGDAIDCIDQKYGAWFEATIIKICRKGAKLFYFVKWDLIDNAQPFQVDENSIRPRAWYVIPENDLAIGERVMLNQNLDNPSEIGHWYDFKIDKISLKKSVRILIGTLYIGT